MWLHAEYKLYTSHSPLTSTAQLTSYRKLWAKIVELRGVIPSSNLISICDLLQSLTNGLLLLPGTTSISWLMVYLVWSSSMTFTLILNFTRGFTMFSQLDMVTSQFVQWLTMLTSTTCTGQASWCCQHCNWYPHLWIKLRPLDKETREAGTIFTVQRLIAYYLSDFTRCEKRVYRDCK